MENKTVVLNEKHQYVACGVSKFSRDKTEAVITFNVGEDIENIKFSRGDKIRFIVNGSYYEFYTAIIEDYDKYERRIVAGQLENDEKNLNEDIKVEVDLTLKILYPEGENLLSRNVHVNDISAGGFCFVSRDSMDVDKKYEAILQVSEEPVIANFVIVRRIFHEDENEYVYGCKFANLSMKEEEMIRKKVYQMISQRRHKK